MDKINRSYSHIKKKTKGLEHIKGVRNAHLKKFKNESF